MAYRIRPIFRRAPGPEVGFGSIASFRGCPQHVRFSAVSGHPQRDRSGSESAQYRTSQFLFVHARKRASAGPQA
jgi:hypothetical protein